MREHQPKVIARNIESHAPFVKTVVRGGTGHYGHPGKDCRMKTARPIFHPVKIQHKCNYWCQPRCEESCYGSKKKRAWSVPQIEQNQSRRHHYSQREEYVRFSQ